jgi:hypothetical protein
LQMTETAHGSLAWCSQGICARDECPQCMRRLPCCPKSLQHPIQVICAYVSPGSTANTATQAPGTEQHSTTPGHTAVASLACASATVNHGVAAIVTESCHVHKVFMLTWLCSCFHTLLQALCPPLPHGSEKAVEQSVISTACFTSPTVTVNHAQHDMTNPCDDLFGPLTLTPSPTHHPCTAPEGCRGCSRCTNTDRTTMREQHLAELPPLQ